MHWNFECQVCQNKHNYICTLYFHTILLPTDYSFQCWQLSNYRYSIYCWDISRTQTHTIYVVRQLAYSTELLVCINEAYKQYKQRRRRIFSTQLYTQALSTLLCSLFSLCFHSLQLVGSSSLCSLDTLTKTSQGGTLIYN
jgi:hypothetical protein